MLEIAITVSPHVIGASVWVPLPETKATLTNLGRHKPLKCSLSCSCQWYCGRNLADSSDEMLQNMVISVELQPLVEATLMLQLLIWLNNMVIECCLFAL